MAAKPRKVSAKNKKAVSGTRALTGERTLHMAIPEYIGTVAGGVWPGYKGWNADYLGGGGSNKLCVYETYFDLSGYQMDDLTLIPMGGLVQAPGLTNGSITADGPIQILDVISQQRLNADEVFTAMNLNNVPGMMAAPGDFQRIAFGQYRGMLGQATFTNPTGQKIYSTIHSDTFGSGEPVGAQKLWIYRFIITPTASNADTLIIPASRFILSAMIVRQKSKEYLTTLARSYSST